MLPHRGRTRHGSTPDPLPHGTNRKPSTPGGTDDDRSQPTPREIRRRYAEAATTAACGQRATDGPDDACFGTSLYDDLEGVPERAGLASLGCGNPIAIADLSPGETVLDLGSGGGIDVLLSAKRVGPTGHAYGLDMTDEMLDLAGHNAAEAGATNVTFLKGQIERSPCQTNRST